MRGGEQVFRIAGVLEAEDPRVLEVVVDDGDDADVLGETAQLGAQAADAAHDQVNPHARRAGRIQLLDELGVGEAVHLRDDTAPPAGARMLGFPADALDEPIAQGARREQEVMESVRPRVAGEQIEQLGQVLAE